MFGSHRRASVNVGEGAKESLDYWRLSSRCCYDERTHAVLYGGEANEKVSDAEARNKSQCEASAGRSDSHLPSPVSGCAGVEQVPDGVLIAL